MKSPEPVDKNLYEKVKKEAKRKFTAFPSAYASAWIVREYKRRGGTYKGRKQEDEGLRRWFKERWINLCELPEIVPCGRPSREVSIEEWRKEYPYCRPMVRVSKKTPKEAGKLSPKEIRRECRRKRS